MEKRNKNLVTTSIISVALCGALLVGSSFAWFTDKVESTGNTIKSGELEITATNDSGNVLDANNPMFVAVDKAEPGWSDYATVNVENTGTLAADVKATFTVKGELAPAMWYSFDDGLTKTAMTNGGTFEVQEQQILENAKADIEITYGMYTTAGNDYQNKTLTMDLSIDAKQSTYEEDGFGSDQYDASAVFPISVIPDSGLGLKNTIENASSGSHLVVTETGAYGNSNLDGKDITVDFQDKILTHGNVNARPGFTIENGATLTLDGTTGGIEAGQFLAMINSGKLIVKGGKYTSLFFPSTPIYIDSVDAELYIEGGDFSSVGFGYGDYKKIEITGGTFGYDLGSDADYSIFIPSTHECVPNGTGRYIVQAK